MRPQRRPELLALLICVLTAAGATAQLAPQRRSAISEKIFRHADLDIPNRLEPAIRLSSPLAQTAKKQLQGLEIAETHAFFDRRAGRWATLMPSVPLLQPSNGQGSAWKSLYSPAGSGSIEPVAWKAIESYLRDHMDQLHVDLSELDPPVITVHDGGNRIQAFAARRVNGVPIRDN